MGYTHYWRRAEQDISRADWARAMARIRPIIKSSADRLIEPSINGELLRFDGDCETFFVTRKFHSDFEFCKTRGRGYDDVVVACLLILAQEFKNYGFIWNSDGVWPNEHEDGIKLSGIGRSDLIPPTRYTDK